MDLQILKNLDYKIYSNKERSAAVSKLLTPEVEEKAIKFFEQDSVSKQLEGLANYILYGKDPKTDKNSVQDKIVQIEGTRYGSFQKKKPESLEALLEGEKALPEEVFHTIERPIYTNPKPTINREKDKDIPGLVHLWEVIDKLKEEVQALKDSGNTGVEFYHKNHLLIELRQQQYVIKESYRPTFHAVNQHSSVCTNLCFTSDTGFLVENNGDDWEWVQVTENIIDFTKPEHIYEFAQLYGDIKKYCWDTLMCDSRFLIYEFEDLVDKTPLSEGKRIILYGKIEKITNEQIRDELYKKTGETYNTNYISTIFKKNICNELAARQKLMIDEFNWREQEDKWKVCTKCGQKKLMDERNFTANPQSKCGFKAQCKECDKKKREIKKQN